MDCMLIRNIVYAGMCEFLFAAKSWLPLAGERLDEQLLDRFAEHCAGILLNGIAT